METQLKILVQKLRETGHSLPEIFSELRKKNIQMKT